MRGLYVDDSKTIPAYYQKLVNSHSRDIRAVNCGVDGFGAHRELEHILSTKFKSGDVAVILDWATDHIKLLLSSGSTFIYDELSAYLSRPNFNKSFIIKDETHFSAVANEAVAQKLYELIEKHKFTGDGRSVQYLSGGYSDGSPELERYILDLKRDYSRYVRKTNGAIVMNCNPFTFGHHYLVETAASQVDTLFIFVVQEDKSFFKYEDRFRMVAEGTARIPNVVVIPSGNFIISKVTFPGYFDKDEKPDATIDASGDLLIFARYIADALNITHRFVGHEPLDRVTNQYNFQMKLILPDYGISVHEIPRKELGGKPINATLVRKMIADGNLEGIKSLVPDTTYRIIKEKYMFYK